MPDQPAITLPDPVFREEGPLLLAGIREFRTFEERAGIPEQWQRFGPFIGHVPGQTGAEAYGACLAPSSGREDGFDYLTAVPVRSLDDLPETLSGVRLERRRYAIFRHDDHVSTIGATCAAIFGDWLPRANVALETSPLFLLEYYGPSFDPRAGRGDIEVRAPLK